MRVALVRPNSRIKATPLALGLGYVAESLRAVGGHEVAVLDARAERLSLGRTVRRIVDFGPDAVGITALNYDSREAHQLAGAVKDVLPGVPVVIGGPYATANREAVASDKNIDVVVVGEGERTAVELFAALEGGTSLRQVRGIVVREFGCTYFTGTRELIEDVDGLVPAWDLLDPAHHFRRRGRNSENILQRSHRALSVFTSRGCPFSCIFCHNVFGKRFRGRSVEIVVDEIAMLVDRYGVQELAIVDDSFNLDINRAKAIARGIADRKLGLHITLPNGIRGDRVDDELLDLLQRAGVYRIAFAVESASPRIQAIIRKGIDLEKVRWAIAETANRGMVATGYFILGFPTETAEDFRETVDYAVESDLHIASFLYLNPFPGTEVARMTGRSMTDVDLQDYSTMSVNVSAASDEELCAAARSAYRRFYLDPVRLMRILRVVPKNMRTVANTFLVLRLLFQGSVVQ